MFRKVLFGVVLGAAFLQASAQDPDEQILRLHAEGKLAEAVELCIQEAPYSTVAKYFLGEYYCHGIPGILEAIPARGREYYVKAFREIRDWYGAGASPREIRWAARCIEFGENDPETAKTWYLKAAKAGDTNSLPRILTYLEHQQITAEELEDIPIPEEMLTLEQKALLGILFLESWKKGDQGKAILFEAARAGHPKALARVAVLYYTGGYGMAQDWEKALQFMEEAVKKGIPAQELPLDEVRERVVQIRQKRYEDALQPPPVMPGDGYPGKRLPYPVSSDLQPWLERFNLTAGWFQRDDVHAKFLKSRGTDEVMTNAIPYLLYTPPKVRDPVPILIYFGGTGEHGTNLVDQFHQTAIFSKITDTEFQKKHPCYLFAPMVPKNSSLRCYKESSSDMADLVCDALYAIIRDAENPPVDINRMYLTGLSYGGSAAYTFPFGYPGRFAASLPVAGNASKEDVPENQIYNIWLLFNEDRYNTTETARRTVREIKAKVERQGGEFRASSFPGKDHNAWDKAWREDSVWDWLFSKTADGKPVPRMLRAGSPRPNLQSGVSPAQFLENAICTASRPGRDDGTGPKRAADSLDATCYVSAEPMTREDWWQIEFPQPVSGRVTIQSGYRDGSGRLSAGRVDVSGDGKVWKPAGRFMRATGECRFVPAAPVRFLRVVPESSKGETLVLREVIITR